jgi:hypothetical protein
MARTAALAAACGSGSTTSAASAGGSKTGSTGPSARASSSPSPAAGNQPATSAAIPHASQQADVWHFVSEPPLHPPRVSVTVNAAGTAPGDIFVSPMSTTSAIGQAAPMILDNAGNPIWVHPLPPGVVATNFRVQMYRGKPVLTWWQGRIMPQGYGEGIDIIANSSYQTIATVKAGNGYQTDLHEFSLTAQGTALVSGYRPQTYDTTAVGGSRKGTLLDSVAQEVDVQTGQVLFQWDPMDHVPLADTHATLFKGMWDPYHVNSIELGSHGDVLISARNTWTIYDVNLRSGAIIWQLGGKQTSFKLSTDVRFAFQHDAQFEGANLMSIFDNEAGPNVGPQSRALLLRLNMATMTATVVDKYTHVGVLANSQGSVQLLANGDVFVGWGAQPFYSEFARSGRLLYDARFPGVDQSYRAFRALWVGQPAGRPSRYARRPVQPATRPSTQAGTEQPRSLAGRCSPAPAPINSRR